MLLATLCTTCGQLVECSNAPHTFCANSHTLKEHSKKLSPSTKVEEGFQRCGVAQPDGDFGKGITGCSGTHGKPQQGPWWGAVDAAIDRQQESQLLEVNKQLSLPLRQAPLFPPTCTLHKTSTTP
jgi:hypothetical protein